LRIRFARGTRLEERAFLEAIRGGYPYLSHMEQSMPRGGRPEYVLVSHATAEKAVEKLKDMDVGVIKYSIDLLPGNIAEVALWR
jgi:hypothetical protein